MLKHLLLFFAIVACLTSAAQSKNLLMGTWQLQYALEPGNKPCHLPKDSTVLKFYSNGNYLWTSNEDSLAGKWKINANKIRFYANKAVNYAGSVGDKDYPFEYKNNFLIIHLPRGGDISCPDEYYKKTSVQ